MMFKIVKTGTKLVFFLCLTLFLSTSWAQEDILKNLKPGDFAKGASIELEPGYALYEMELDESVYRNLYRGDQGDIRIFNAKDEVVPHTIKAPPKPEFVQLSQLVKLPIFPLLGDPQKNLDDLHVRVKKNRSGSIVDVKIRDRSKNGNEKKRVAYIVDATKHKDFIHAIRVYWSPKGGSGVVQNLNIHASDDLEKWRLVKSNGVLFRLKHQGQSLDQSLIKLGDIKAKYLRVSWPEKTKDFVINRIDAGYVKTEQLHQPTYQWSRITGRPDPNKSGTFIYDTEGYLPAYRARIVLPEKNIAVKVDLASTNALTFKPRWNTHRNRYLAYELEVDGTTLTPPATISLRGKTSKRYWRLTVIDSPGALASGQLPVLELGWLPDKLAFLARGEGPYLLAVGNEEVGPASSAMRQLIQSMTKRKIKPRIASVGGI